MKIEIAIEQDLRNPKISYVGPDRIPCSGKAELKKALGQLAAAQIEAAVKALFPGKAAPEPPAQ